MIAPLWALNAIKNLCSTTKWTKVHQNFWGCYPLRPPIVPNFIEISQTSLEMGGVNWASDKKNYFVTDRKVTT